MPRRFLFLLGFILIFAFQKTEAQNVVFDTIGNTIITADTIVVLDDKVLGKPKDAEEARCMLHALSGKTHQVVTGVVLTTKEQQKHFSVVSNVTFKTLSDNEIDYYVDTYKPMDKAGAYGIQEWIGYVGVTRLEGSYFNVMGLPVQRIYEAMKEFSICDGILSK